jgi:membrane protease YdiL (CAAX protease family)
VVPLVEELMFRGAFFGALVRTTSAGVAAGVTGAAFVVCHLDTRIWLPLALVAGVMSGLRLLSGSVLPSIALHIAFNAVTLTSVLLGLVPIDHRFELSWQVALLGWLVVAALCVGAWHLAGASLDAEQARLEDEHGP